jgi:hypothetical protein
MQAAVILLPVSLFLSRVKQENPMAALQLQREGATSGCHLYEFWCILKFW